MENPCKELDKRTNDYKNCMERYKEAKATEEQKKADDLVDDVEISSNDLDQSRKSENTGLGDVIAKVTKVTKVDKLVEKIFGENCGCDERRERLNKLSWFRKSKRVDMIPEEFRILHKYFGDGKKPRSLSPKDKKILIPIYNRLFFIQYKVNTSCGSCLGIVVNSLHSMYVEYSKND